MKLTQLRYFQAICNYGSLMQAAAHLSVSQPALSAALRELEREFGVKLFIRVGKKLKLTKEGDVLLKLSEDLLQRAANLTQIMLDLSEKRNRLRLGITPMLCAALMPQICKEFTARYPEVYLELVEDGRYPLFELLENRQIDMVIMSEGIGGFTPLEQVYHRIPLTELEYCCCVAKEHRLAGYSCIRAQDIGNDPLVVFREGYQQQEFIQRIFSEAGITPNIAFQSGQLSTVWEMVAHCGMVTLSYRALSELRPDLCFIPMSHGVKINLFWRKGGFLYSDMHKMICCVQEIFQLSPPDAVL